MSALTKEQIDALPGLVAEATPGPWKATDQGAAISGWRVLAATPEGPGWPTPSATGHYCMALPPPHGRGRERVQMSNARLIALAPSLAATVIEQQRIITALSEDASKAAELALEVERLSGFISDFASAKFERIDRRAQDLQDDLDPITDHLAVEAWQDDARAALDAKP